MIDLPIMMAAEKTCLEFICSFVRKANRRALYDTKEKLKLNGIKYLSFWLQFAFVCHKEIKKPL